MLNMLLGNNFLSISWKSWKTKWSYIGTKEPKCTGWRKEIETLISSTDMRRRGEGEGGAGSLDL